MGKGRKQPGVLRRLLPPGLDHLSSVPFLVASFPRVSSTRLTSSIHSAPAGPVGDRWMEGGNRQVNRPDCYQRLEFFIQVLRVLCPNLTDASLVVCVVSLTRRITRSLCSLVSLGSLVVPPAERRERIGRVTKEVRRWDNINKILAQLLPSVVNRLPGSLCSSVSDDEPIKPSCPTAQPPLLRSFPGSFVSVPFHFTLVS